MLFRSRILSTLYYSPFDARDLLELTFIQVVLQRKGHPEELKLRGMNRIELASELIEDFENFFGRICTQTHLSL